MQFAYDTFTRTFIFTVRNDVESMLSTGMFSDGTVRPVDNNNQDQNWVVSFQTQKYAASIVKNNGAWQANDSQSRWLSTPNGAWDAPPGHFIYTNTFDMWGYDPKSTDIVLKVAVDNSISRLFLNGKPMAVPKVGANFRLGPDYVLKGWHPGLNTLEIEVVNAGTTVNPTGLRVLAAGESDSIYLRGCIISVSVESDWFSVNSCS